MLYVWSRYVMGYKPMNKFCAGKPAAVHGKCVIQSRALSQMLVSASSPRYLILNCGLGIYRWFHLAYTSLL